MMTITHEILPIIPRPRYNWVTNQIPWFPNGTLMYLSNTQSLAIDYYIWFLFPFQGVSTVNVRQCASVDGVSVNTP